MLAAFGATAQQYKWVDQNGKVQYGDLPPPGVKATPLKSPPGPASGAAPEGKKDAKKLSPEQAFQKRQKDEQERQAKAEKEKSEAATKSANCESARANLRTLESGQRVSSTNAAGERVFMDDAQIAQQTGAARKAVADWCK
ncbi:MAG: DUF4124 domain-containing protein [Betaproteobacteria bacterium]